MWETEPQLPQQVVFMRRDKSNDLFTYKLYLLTSVISLRPSEIQAKVLDHLSDMSASCGCCSNPRDCSHFPIIFLFLGLFCIWAKKRNGIVISLKCYILYFSFSTCVSHDLQFIGHVCVMLAFFSPFNDRFFNSFLIIKRHHMLNIVQPKLIGKVCMKFVPRHDVAHFCSRCCTTFRNGVYSGLCYINIYSIRVEMMVFMLFIFLNYRGGSWG